MSNAAREPLTDDGIRAVVARLARPHRSGGSVIERAAILAEGNRSAAILGWIEDHAGEAEAAETATPKQGIHGSRFGGSAPSQRGPARYLLPAGALTRP